MSRPFPPPWSVDDPDVKLGQDCFIVRDHNGQALGPAFEAIRDKAKAVGARLRLFRGGAGTARSRVGA
jgi:hypothetical protein